ncbi:hypothetical protein AKJ56_01705 [candidate division MSBL1 archaeon SCGC-AAA382N08]|uniref:Sulfotransferase domain-containing protein n=1 Tax=candidate division MSBL1 archaeon SCGC-AAA382N08 TaxID=1698285 RepID=A0A133VP29_9EURY|nr:hypothetical protein AKJ56_01705 [candidate division MSBL1 archaeon SCGC-AAA382N08]
MVEHYNLDYEINDISAGGLIDEADAQFRYSKQGVPRIQHSHFPYYFMFKNKKVLLLIRDLRDSIVSRYEKHCKREKDPVDFSVFLREGFLNERSGSFKRPLEQKVNFLNSWCKSKDKPDRLLVKKYKELKEKQRKAMKEVLNFLEIPDFNFSLVEKAVDFGSFENMKKLEGKEASEGRVVNKGKTNRYQDHFSPEDKKFFEEYVDKNLVCDFGYNYQQWS